jgi:hypothetical protein
MRGDPNIHLGLPLEIFDSILALVVTDSRVQTYSKIGLVNQSWYHASFRHIYSTWVFEDGSLISLLLFLERILINPQLAGFVRKTRLRWGDVKPGKIDDELMARLKSMKFSNFFWKHQFHEALSGYTKGEPLEIFVRATIKAILAQLPANSHLVIGAPILGPLTFEAVLHRTKNNAGTTPFHNIKEITLCTHTLYRNPLRPQTRRALWVLETHMRELTVLPSLEKLHILRSAIEKPKWGSSTAETMKEITLVDPVFGNNWDQWLAPVRHLKTFALHYSAFFPGKRSSDPGGIPDSMVLQNALRPYHDSLEYLHFVKSHLHHAETVAIGSLREFKKLRALSISWRILVQLYPASLFSQLVDTLPLSLMHLRIFIDAIDLPYKNSRKRDATLIIDLIRRRRIDFTNLRSLDLVVLHHQSSLEMTGTMIENPVSILRDICMEEEVTFRYFPLLGNNAFTEELPDFAGKPWNYIQGLLPDFHSVMADLTPQ